ncbi:hypothetical protein RF11_14050 [Thelohanellus kitauei]|uniref:Uncharacterized protein n=1 Tax=Thelohanellus kitauei TaxID=669202 RepID=A0A0C2J7C0_THEKT|nr:hypothetical protein RF11_14050 [Thelohanellus kitauei]
MNFRTVFQARWASSNETTSSLTVISSSLHYTGFSLHSIFPSVSSSVEDPPIEIGQLDLPVLVHLCLGRQSFPDLDQLGILCLGLDLLINEFDLRETVIESLLADLLPNTPFNV